MPRAFLRIGGTTVAGQQLGVAIALGCERIVCLAPALTKEIVELQHRAEQSGAQFHVIPGPRPLQGLVTASDELIAFSDGLFSSRDRACSLLADQQSVLVQPIEQGLAAGFERIDLNHAAAGAMRIPGRLVERLSELPADCDAVSSLQRIALQAGVRQQPIGVIGPGGAFWSLVQSDSDAHAIEPQWIRQHSSDPAPSGPSRALAMVAVRRLGPSMLHAGSGSGILVTAAVLTALLALGAGWMGFIALGFGLCGFGWIQREFADLLARVETESAPKNVTATVLAAFGWVIDGLLVVLLGYAANPIHPMHGLERFFPAFMLIALLRILASVYVGRWKSWIADRGVIAIVLMGAVAGRVAGETAHLGAALVAILILLALGNKSRLTGL
ncbi:hypothetical protein [Novosphingobium sp.]|uniref:hypothetical protein n=1 Tax=Novosphingobium sp. TaxID=1874826 RepID=UPI0037044666